MSKVVVIDSENSEINIYDAGQNYYFSLSDRVIINATVSFENKPYISVRGYEREYNSLCDDVLWTKEELEESGLNEQYFNKIDIKTGKFMRRFPFAKFVTETRYENKKRMISYKNEEFKVCLLGLNRYDIIYHNQQEEKSATQFTYGT